MSDDTDDTVDKKQDLLINQEPEESNKNNRTTNLFGSSDEKPEGAPF